MTSSHMGHYSDDKSACDTPTHAFTRVHTHAHAHAHAHTHTHTHTHLRPKKSFFARFSAESIKTVNC